jgi:hypothetical protein
MNIQDNDFDYEKIVTLTCQEYEITTNEFFSDFRYGNLPQSRKMVCYILYRIGMKNIQISRITGFKPPRISNSIRDMKVSSFGAMIYHNIMRKLP